jgi:hypothetical protein
MRSLTTPRFSFTSLSGLCCLLVFLCFSGNAMAELVSDFYDVTLPVADESSEVRNAAMADGLAEVLVRQSGEGDILQKLTPPSATAYVKQYRYEPLSPPDPKDPDAKQIRLQYNSTLVMDFLRKNGFPIWGDHRPLAVIWLAVRDGSNQYVLKNDDISAFKTQIDKLLRQRGIPAVWPAYDRQDQAVLKFADIWAGFSDPLKQASARYSQGPILAGNLAWNGSAWTSDWTLIDQHFSQQTSLRGTDYEQILSDAINQLSDVMGKQYAVLESVDRSEDKQMAMEIENVKSLANYVHVKKYLSSLQAVQDVQMKRITNNKVEFSLFLRSTVADFINLLAASSQLKAVSDAELNASTGVSAQNANANTGTGSQAPNPASVVASKLYHYRLVH